MKDKEFEMKEVAEIIAKSMYKSVKKAIKFKNPVQDVLDPNFTPESPDKENPLPKTGTLYKKDVAKASCLEPEHLDNKVNDLMKPSKNNKLQQFLTNKKKKK